VDLEELSVVGMKWKNIRATIHELVGYDDDCDFWLPGHIRPISQRFRERLSDLELLNTKQCEGKKGSDANAPSKSDFHRSSICCGVFSERCFTTAHLYSFLKLHKICLRKVLPPAPGSMEFYRGNKVSWWNFYYKSHVLKRNCFDNTRSKIENVLKYPKKQNAGPTFFSK
jgi:hypothetical protein